MPGVKVSNWSLTHWLGLGWVASIEFDLRHTEIRWVEFHDLE